MYKLITNLIFSSIPKESIVDVLAEVKTVSAKVESCSQQDVELHVEEVWVSSASQPQLPLQIEDAMRKITEEDVKDELSITVSRDTRLNNRVLDLRTPTNQVGNNNSLCVPRHHN